MRLLLLVVTCHGILGGGILKQNYYSLMLFLMEVVKVNDLHPVSRVSTPAGTHMSQWLWQEGHLVKIAPEYQ